MKDYLKLWGFREEHYSKKFKELNLKSSHIKYLNNYIDNVFPKRGLIFLGHPKVVLESVSVTVKMLYENNKFNNRVSIIDIPTYLTNYFSIDSGERVGMENKVVEDLANSDLVVLQEMGLAKWTSNQQTRLYTLLNDRYTNGLPLFGTSSCTVGELEDRVGTPNFFRIADSCEVLNIGNI
jgi:hypothetical protein